MKCTFCSKEMEPGTGKVLVLNNGKKLFFCSNKCEKNMLKLKRNPSKLKWSHKKKV